MGKQNWNDFKNGNIKLNCTMKQNVNNLFGKVISSSGHFYQVILIYEKKVDFSIIFEQCNHEDVVSWKFSIK